MQPFAKHPVDSPRPPEPKAAKLSAVATTSVVFSREQQDGARPGLLHPLVFVLAGFIGCWALIFVLYPPHSQQFALLHDWLSTRGLVQFAYGGGIDYFDYAQAPPLGQWLSAIPFVWAFGFTFACLRLSTIALSLIGLAAFYELMRHEGLSRSRAAFLAGTLAFCPLFFLLTGTFTREVAALAFCLLGLALYQRAIASNGIVPLAAATAVAVLAVLTKQDAIAVPIAAACVFLMRGGTLRGNVRWQIALLLPLIVGLASALCFEIRPRAQYVNTGPMPPHLAVLLPYWSIQFCGLAAVPALALVAPLRSWRRFLVGLALTAAFASYWSQVPDTPNRGLCPYGLTAVLSRTGIGEPSLFVGPRPTLLDASTQWYLTVLGCIAGAALIARCSRWPRREFWQKPILAFTVIEALLILAKPRVYDRDFLFVIPGAIFLAGAPPVNARARWHCGFACLLLMATVSVCLVHDWFASSRALWDLGRRAIEERHIDAREMEGGLTWDGWHRKRSAVLGVDPFKDIGPYPTTTPRLTLMSTHRVLPELAADYALAFSQPPRCMVLDSEPYRLWLVPGDHSILLVKYAPPTPTTADWETP